MPCGHIRRSRSVRYARGQTVHWGVANKFNGDFVGSKRRVNNSTATIDNLSHVYRNTSGKAANPMEQRDGNNFTAHKFTGASDVPSDFRTQHYVLPMKGRFHSYAQKEAYSQLALTRDTTSMHPNHHTGTSTSFENDAMIGASRKGRDEWATHSGAFVGDWGFIVLGDTVEVTMYTDKGKRGRIVELNPQFGYVRIEGIRVKEDTLYDQESSTMKIVQIPQPVFRNEIKLIDPVTGKPTDVRPAWKLDPATNAHTLVRISDISNATIEWPTDETPPLAEGGEGTSVSAATVQRVSYDASVDIEELVRRKLYYLEMREFYRRQEEFEARRPIYDRYLDEEKAWRWQVWRRVAVELEGRENSYISSVAAEYQTQRAASSEDLPASLPDRYTSINPAFQTATAAFRGPQRADIVPPGPTTIDAASSGHDDVAGAALASLQWRPPYLVTVSNPVGFENMPEQRNSTVPRPISPSARGHALTRRDVSEGSAMDRLVAEYLKETSAPTDAV